MSLHKTIAMMGAITMFSLSQARADGPGLETTLAAGVSLTDGNSEGRIFYSTTATRWP